MTNFLTGTNRGLGGLRVDDASTDVFGVNHIVFAGGATLVDNSNGKITVTVSGGGGGSMTSWTVAGASGSTTVTDGQTVTITGSGGITTAESGRTVTITPTGVLEDLNTLGAPSANGEFIVATGAGAFAYESGATVRTSLGLGTMALQNAGTVAITGGSIDRSCHNRRFNNRNHRFSHSRWRNGRRNGGKCKNESRTWNDGDTR